MDAGLPGFESWYTSVCYSTLTAKRGYSSLSVEGDSSNLVTATTVGDGPTYANQYAYQSPLTVVWVSDDLSLFHPASAPILKSPASNAAKTTSAAPSQNTPSGLSTGAEAGIGVGVAIAVLLAVSVLVIWMLRLRKRRQRTAEGSAAGRVSYKENHTYELEYTPPAPRHEVSGGFEEHQLSNKPE